MRVQVPVYSDHWMRGDRYGEVVAEYSVSANGSTSDRYRVKLDKSGRLASFNADDCKVIEMN